MEQVASGQGVAGGNPVPVREAVSGCVIVSISKGLW